MIKGKFHEESSNIAAYVRFTEVEMAVKATAFNGSLVEGHSVRVDLAAAARCRNWILRSWAKKSMMLYSSYLLFLDIILGKKIIIMYQVT